MLDDGAALKDIRAHVDRTYRRVVYLEYADKYDGVHPENSKL
jgi:hypothetical protein